MAKYDVDYACGHPVRVDLTGRQKDREWRLEREAERLCEDCFCTHRERSRLAENEKAKTLSAEIGFPDLTGTDKQTGWAAQIRLTKWRRLEQLIDVQMTSEKNAAEPPEDMQKWAESQRFQARSYLFDAVRESRFWIDFRECDITELIKKASEIG